MVLSPITDVAAYLRVLDTLDVALMFRGQARGWPLLPSIARLTHEVKGYANWNLFQLDLLERFVRFAEPLLDSKPQDSVEWLVHAQHHGVPTRLLDWTTNPLKALFWAVENRSYDRDEGVVWVFSPRAWREDVLKPTVLDEDDLTPFFPKHLNNRVIAQEACFVSFPLDLDCNPMQPMEAAGAYPDSVESLERLAIPASAKSTIRNQLKTLGVSHRFVYPDLEGIAKQINEDIREL